jgi:hypothetical protein
MMMMMMMRMMMMMMLRLIIAQETTGAGVSEHPVLAHNRHTGSSMTFKEWERSTKMNESAEGM